jgi:hypothetical protein
LLTLPCAGDPVEPSASSAPAARAPEAPPSRAAGETAESKTPENARVVTIDPSVRQPVCRRVVPTGSRIAERRCEAPQRGPTAAEEANRAIVRRDIEAMRDQQMMREQVRGAAQADAMRRRAQGQ